MWPRAWRCEGGRTRCLPGSSGRYSRHQRRYPRRSDLLGCCRDALRGQGSGYVRAKGSQLHELRILLDSQARRRRSFQANPPELIRHQSAIGRLSTPFVSPAGNAAMETILTRLRTVVQRLPPTDDVSPTPTALRTRSRPASRNAGLIHLAVTSPDPPISSQRPYFATARAPLSRCSAAATPSPAVR